MTHLAERNFYLMECAAEVLNLLRIHGQDEDETDSLCLRIIFFHVASCTSGGPIFADVRHILQHK